jgi:hypothetical protein
MTKTPARNAAEALEHIRAGGRAIVSTRVRLTIIDRKALAAFERMGEWLLKDEGEGIRLRSGKGSVYLFAGQLQLID